MFRPCINKCALPKTNFRKIKSKIHCFYRTMRNIVSNLFQCLRDNVELLCNAAEMFYNSGDYNSAKSFFQRVKCTSNLGQKVLRISKVGAGSTNFCNCHCFKELILKLDIIMSTFS